MKSYLLNLGKEQELARMSKKERKELELKEMDKLFEEMGIDVPKEDTKQNEKKNKRRRKKKNKNKEGATNEEEKKEEVVTEKQPESELVVPEVEETPEEKEAKIKEALNKRFNKGGAKKPKVDDAVLRAKKQALLKANKKKKGNKKAKKLGRDL